MTVVTSRIGAYDCGHNQGQVHMTTLIVTTVICIEQGDGWHEGYIEQGDGWHEGSIEQGDGWHEGSIDQGDGWHEVSATKVKNRQPVFCSNLDFKTISRQKVLKSKVMGGYHYKQCAIPTSMMT